MAVVDRRAINWSMLAATIGLALAGCQKANPPLIPPDRSAALAAIKGPNDALMSANTADDLVTLNGEALRRRMRTELLGVIPAYWPPAQPGRAKRPQVAFVACADPQVDCTTVAMDGTLCSLTLALPDTSTSSPDLRQRLAGVRSITPPPGPAAEEVAFEAAANAAVGRAPLFVRYGLDDGAGLFFKAVPDPRPMPGSGAVTVVTGIDGKVPTNALGTLPADCRTETQPGASTQRRTSTVEYKPFLVSVSRYVPASMRPPTDLANPDMLRAMQDATRLLASMVLRSPPLQHVLPPTRLANDSGAMIAGMTMQGRDSSVDDRSLIARNAAKTPSHDVASQTDFDTLCRGAAKDRRLLLILIVSPSQTASHMLYTDNFVPFADHAMLAVVQMAPDGERNAWATAFAKASGAGKWGALIATDRPRVSADHCDVGRLCISPWERRRHVPRSRHCLPGVHREWTGLMVFGNEHRDLKDGCRVCGMVRSLTERSSRGHPGSFPPGRNVEAPCAGAVRQRLGAGGRADGGAVPRDLRPAGGRSRARGLGGDPKRGIRRLPWLAGLSPHRLVIGGHQGAA